MLQAELTKEEMDEIEYISVFYGIPLEEAYQRYITGNVQGIFFDVIDDEIIDYDEMSYCEKEGEQWE